MVDYEIIEDILIKSIVDTVKCNKSNGVKNRGSTGKIRDESFGRTLVSYDDGTRILFNADGGVDSIGLDGVLYESLNENSYDFFKYQDDDLKSKKAEVSSFQNYNWFGGIMDKHEWSNEYEFTSYMMDEIASSFGLKLNKEVYYGDEKLRKYSEDEEGGTLGRPTVVTDSELHVNHFFDLARQNRIDKENMVLVTYTKDFHDSDSLDKKSFTNKGFTSTTTGGGDSQELQNLFKRVGGWTVCTVVKKDSDVRGLFFGNALNEIYGKRYHDVRDWESEVNLPPRTRFTRDLIDEEHHIIIQHIDKQYGVE